MSSRLYSVTIGARDPATLAGFWAAALRYAVAYSTPLEVALEAPDRAGPALVFVAVPELKTVQHRVHLDLNPDHQAGEVDRLLALGATRADVGQGEVSWVVLADPEGNEFCVLTAREPA